MSHLLTHERIWAAIDQLAAAAGLSTRDLARRAGLDPSTFHRSRRMTEGGRASWPSIPSVAKALTATNASMETFVALLRVGDAPATPDAVIPQGSGDCDAGASDRELTAE
jgi:phage repressor protein C with HTH and peptisase S24 domain